MDLTKPTFYPSGVRALQHKTVGEKGRSLTLGATEEDSRDEQPILAGRGYTKGLGEAQLFDRLGDIGIPHRRSPRLSELAGHDGCVRQVRNVLREARIPHESLVRSSWFQECVGRGSCSFEPAFAQARLHRPHWSSP